jgi:hypothetical protein
MPTKAKGALRELQFAEGISLADKPARERLLEDMLAAGVQIYLIAGREFIDTDEWQATLRKLAVPADLNAMRAKFARRK